MHAIKLKLKNEEIINYSRFSIISLLAYTYDAQKTISYFKHPGSNDCMKNIVFF